MSRTYNAEAIQDWLISSIATQMQIEPSDLEINEPFARYGLDSLDATTLAADLEQWIGRSIPSTIFWDYPTIESLTEHLAKD